MSPNEELPVSQSTFAEPLCFLNHITSSHCWGGFLLGRFSAMLCNAKPAEGLHRNARQAVVARVDLNKCSVSFGHVRCAVSMKAVSARAAPCH